MSPTFALTLTGLPDWLKRDDHYGFTASTGILRLTGTPPKNGTSKITVTAVNEFGAAQPVTITIITSTKGDIADDAP